MHASHRVQQTDKFFFDPKYSRGDTHCKSFLLFLKKGKKTVQREAKRTKPHSQQEGRRNCTPKKQKELGDIARKLGT